jgi:RES domain-containing protein
LYAGGRWHHRGNPILYTAQTRAGVVLEVLVHIPKTKPATGFSIVEYELPDDVSRTFVTLADLPSAWDSRPPIVHTQNIGTKWLKEKNSLLLFVPTAIIPQAGLEEWNVLINPAHEEMRHIFVKGIADFSFDERLFPEASDVDH